MRKKGNVNLGNFQVLLEMSYNNIKNVKTKLEIS